METGRRASSSMSPVGYAFGPARAPRPAAEPGEREVRHRRTAARTAWPPENEIATLFRARGADFEHICDAADALRREVNGDVVSYVVNRNINYTNVCYFKCQFCAFSKGKLSENLRGTPYDLETSEIVRRAREAWERGGTEVCMQGGIHPEYTGKKYLEIVSAVKEALPRCTSTPSPRSKCGRAPRPSV
jgi:FO synthase